MSQKIPALLAVMTLLGPLHVTAQTVASDAPVPVAAPVLVELFTSEGCSSCPPAESVLGQLASRPGVIAIAFHVDYWDSIGWRDRFQISEATGRQEHYVDALGLSSAFTPQIVVDGRSSLVGSDDRRVTAAIDHSSGVIPLRLNVAAGEVAFDIPAGSSAERCDVNLVAYLSHASTNVGRGENAGRTLEEFNIVRVLRRLGSFDGHPATFRVQRASLPRDADRVAVFLQRVNQGSITAAATAVLPP